MYALQAVADGHWPGPWFLLFPLFWLALIFVVVVVLRRTAWRRHCTGSPVAELGRRYAQGEIDEDEYRARRAVLTEQYKGGAK